MPKKSERTTFTHRGLEVIADFFKEEYQGVVRGNNKQLFHAYGQNIDEVLLKLIEFIDNDEKIKEKYHRKHVNFEEMSLYAFYSDKVFQGFASFEQRKLFKVQGDVDLEKTIAHLKKLINENPAVLEHARSFNGRYKGVNIEAKFMDKSFAVSIAMGKTSLYEQDGFEDINEATDTAKRWVDSKEELIVRLISEAHNQFLKSMNIGAKSTAKMVKVSAVSHRVSHCWNCKHTVDNHYQYECSTCGWIICSCGACGCSYGAI